jgi:hypothetical protein
MSKVKSTFIGPDGLRHGWRFLIFLAAIVLVAQFLEQLAIAFLAVLGTLIYVVWFLRRRS